MVLGWIGSWGVGVWMGLQSVVGGFLSPPGKKGTAPNFHHQFWLRG